MKRPQKFLTIAMSVAMVLALAGLADAQQMRPGRGLARAFRAGQFVKGLNLTADQKAQIKTVIANNKTQIASTRTQLLQARLDMLKGNTGAAAELGNALTAAANLRTTILGQIKPILTSDQLAQLQQRQQQREQRLQQRLDRLNKKAG